MRVSVSVATTRSHSGEGAYHHQMSLLADGYRHQMSLSGGWVSPLDVTSRDTPEGLWVSQKLDGYPRGQMSITEGVPYLSHGACDIPTPERNDHTCENITFPLPVMIVRLLHFNILLQEAKFLSGHRHATIH